MMETILIIITAFVLGIVGVVLVFVLSAPSEFDNHQVIDADNDDEWERTHKLFPKPPYHYAKPDDMVNYTYDEDEPYCDECGETESFVHTMSDASKEWYTCNECGNKQVTVFRGETL